MWNCREFSSNARDIYYVASLKVKVKIKFVKRHKTTHNVHADTEALATLQLTTGSESYSKQMCLESSTKNRQTARFDD